jgi:PAS domain-containing protein
MAVRAATDGFNSVPPDGDEGFGSGFDAATAVIDGRGRVLAWSAGARRLLGYAAGDVTGRPAAKLLASDLPASAVLPGPSKGTQPCCRRVVRSLALAPAVDMVHRVWPMISERSIGEYPGTRSCSRCPAA